MSSLFQSRQVNNLQANSHSTILKHVNTLPLPSSSTPVVYRNKTISYACMNVIRTWNFETGREESLFIPVQGEDWITALAELKTEDLVVGTAQGRIYLEKDSSWIEPSEERKGAVKQILIVGPKHIVVEFTNNRKFLVKIENREYLKNFEPKAQVCRLKENFLATLCDGLVQVFDVNDLERPTRFKACYSAMRAEKDNFLLLKCLDRIKLTIWDSEKNSFLKPFKFWRREIKTDQFKTLVLIDSQTLIIPYWHEGVYLEKWSFNEVRKKWTLLCHSKTAGFCKAVNMIHVDDWIMYATPKHFHRKIDAGVHVFDKSLRSPLTHIISTDEEDFELVALDGYIAVETRKSKSIQIIKYPKHKKILFIGEGDFSFTQSFTAKHRKLSKNITATEIKTRKETEEQLTILGAQGRLKNLEDKGVTLRFEVDAQRLNEHFSFSRFEHIRWNCPFGDSADAMAKGVFRDVILKFFDSCRQIQRIGDRIYITLMRESWSGIKRQKENPIVLGSTLSGYRLIKKREFGKKRYPSYEHKKTDGYLYELHNNSQKREFIFEKIHFGKQYTTEKPHQIKQYDPTIVRQTYQYTSRTPVQTTQQDLTDYYFECSTDYDSSDYDEESSKDKLIEMGCGGSMLQPGVPQPNLLQSKPSQPTIPQPSSSAYQDTLYNDFHAPTIKKSDRQSLFYPLAPLNGPITSPVMSYSSFQDLEEFEDYESWVFSTEMMLARYGRVKVEQMLTAMYSNIEPSRVLFNHPETWLNEQHLGSPLTRQTDLPQSCTLPWRSSYHDQPSGAMHGDPDLLPPLPKVRRFN